jgi:peptidoglycan/LPS O-acetylase OafA/YrhL
MNISSPALSKQAAASRIDSLDILRGLSALAVAVYHLSIFSELTNDGSRANNVIAILGNYGVECFFIISGFCFFYLYSQASWNRKSLTEFHIKRFFRIAPLFYLAMTSNLVLGEKVGPGFSARMLAENLSLTFGFFHPNHALVVGGWSIGIEYVFYLVFPLLALVTRRKSLLWILTFAFLVLAWPWNFHKVYQAISSDQFHTYVQIPNHAFLFLLGGILADLRSRIQWRIAWPWFMLTLGVLALIFFPRGPVFYNHIDVMAGWLRVWYVVACFLMVALFAFFEVPRNPLRTVLVFLGNASYSIYLLHPLIMLGLSRLMGNNTRPMTAFLLGLSSTLVLSGLVYYGMEKPAIHLGRRIAGKVRDRAA